MRRVVLRLDSGALIGTPSELGITSSEPVVRLSPEEAAKIGRLDYSHVLHARKLLRQAAEELGYDLKNCPELQTDEETDEGRSEGVVSDTPPPKKRERGRTSRQRVATEGAVDDLAARSPAVSTSSRLEFYDKCCKILDDTIQDLGQDAAFFMVAVDPREVPDYLNVVKSPMDLGLVRQRLDEGFYDSPRDFADDVRLVWSNCFLYNKKGEHVEKIGRRGSMCFENHWAMSGFAEEHRQKRLNAGRPAQKYEPEELNTDTPTKKSSKTMGRQGKARTKQTKGGRNAAGDVDDISSKVEHGSYEDRKMSPEHMQNLANCLSELSGQMLKDVIKIMESNGRIDMNKEDGEEIELDMSELSNRTLWKLDAYVKEHNIQPTGEAGVVVNKSVLKGSSSSESSSDFSSSDSDPDVSSKMGE